MITQDHPAFDYLNTPGISDVAAALVYLADALKAINDSNKVEAQKELDDLKKQKAQK